MSRAKFVASGVCSTVFSANPVTKLSLACVAGEIRERATFGSGAAIFSLTNLLAASLPKQKHSRKIPPATQVKRSQRCVVPHCTSFV